MTDFYDKFAYEYDEFGSIGSYLGDEAAFFDQLFKEQDVKTVLDCACGTGQHLFMLAQLGYQVQGSDFSRSMLEVATQNLQERGLSIPLRQCDFRCLEEVFEETFDAIVCLTNSLPHLHTDEELLQAVSSMKKRLNPGGLLIFTSGTTHYTLTLPSVEVVVNREDFSRIFVKEQDKGLQTIHVLDLYHSPQRMEENQYDIVYRILLDEEYRQLMTKAGMAEVQIFGGYDRQPYHPKSRRLIVVAQL